MLDNQLYYQVVWTCFVWISHFLNQVFNLLRLEDSLVSLSLIRVFSFHLSQFQLRFQFIISFYSCCDRLQGMKSEEKDKSGRTVVQPMSDVIDCSERGLKKTWTCSQTMRCWALCKTLDAKSYAFWTWVCVFISLALLRRAQISRILNVYILTFSFAEKRWLEFMTMGDTMIPSFLPFFSFLQLWMLFRFSYIATFITMN